LREDAVVFVGVRGLKTMACAGPGAMGPVQPIVLSGPSCHVDKAYDVGIGPRFRDHRSGKRMTGEDRRSVLEREDTASVSHVIGQRGKRVLDGRNVQPSALEALCDSGPGRTIGISTMNQHDVVHHSTQPFLVIGSCGSSMSSREQSRA